jgi:hypothetical protein
MDAYEVLRIGRIAQDEDVVVHDAELHDITYGLSFFNSYMWRPRYSP